VENTVVLDVITNKTATSSYPMFMNDRFGIKNGALSIVSEGTAWSLPEDTYIQGDTTVTMWVRKNRCGGSSTYFAPFGINYINSLTYNCKIFKI
jgi:hypothetical protein